RAQLDIGIAADLAAGRPCVERLDLREVALQDAGRVGVSIGLGSARCVLGEVHPGPSPRNSCRADATRAASMMRSAVVWARQVAPISATSCACGVAASSRNASECIGTGSSVIASIGWMVGT